MIFKKQFIVRTSQFTSFHINVNLVSNLFSNCINCTLNFLAFLTMVMNMSIVHIYLYQCSVPHIVCICSIDIYYIHRLIIYKSMIILVFCDYMSDLFPEEIKLDVITVISDNNC